MKYYISPPAMNPLERLLAALSSVVLLAGAFFFGIFALLVLGGIFFGIGLALWIRSWWLRRRGGAQTILRDARGKGNVIDAEYTVVSRRHD